MEQIVWVVQQRLGEQRYNHEKWMYEWVYKLETLKGNIVDIYLTFDAAYVKSMAFIKYHKEYSPNFTIKEDDLPKKDIGQHKARIIVYEYDEINHFTNIGTDKVTSHSVTTIIYPYIATDDVGISYIPLDFASHIAFKETE